MEVIWNHESLINLKTFEGLILSNLFQWGFLDGTSWDDLAVAVDLVNNVGEAIELGQTFSRELHWREEASIDESQIGGTFSWDDYFVEFSGENTLNFIKKMSASVTQGRWKLWELLAVTSAPEKAFLSKANLSKIVNSNCNEVVS